MQSHFLGPEFNSASSQMVRKGGAMIRQSGFPSDDVIDNQILVLLHRHRRLTFLTLADALPLYTWQSLFAALNRLRTQEQVELLPLAADYEVIWRSGRETEPLLSKGGHLQVR